MRWDIIFCVVMITLSVIIVIKRWIEGEKRNGKCSKTRPPVSVVPPPPAPVIKLANRSHGWMWWATFVTFGLLILVFVSGIFSQLANENGLPVLSVHKEVVAKPRAEPYRDLSSKTIMVRAGKWTEVKVPCKRHFRARVSPANSVVVVKTPDGKVRIDGRGHENDHWGVIKGGNGLYQIWKVSTNDDREISYTVSWW